MMIHRCELIRRLVWAGATPPNENNVRLVQIQWAEQGPAPTRRQLFCMALPSRFHIRKSFVYNETE